ncbi:hypothetical protein C1H46_029337 [Malus baccata]|uniref:Uncharacterized protein n=1 Tax=Malus baccata TaxID=106549 RepID=A0A540LF02_MALBA|nr:hypothetical protein C1H46_029337 [Malus baccata]
MKVVVAYLLAMLGGKTTTTSGGGAVAVAAIGCGGGGVAIALATAEAKKEEKQANNDMRGERKGKKWVRLSQHKNQTNLQYEP